jgi:Uma2 family endonuclease
MRVALPVLEAPATIAFGAAQRFDDEAYFAFCAANPDLRIERTSQGEIVIVPPAGGESSYRSMMVGAQLARWAERDRRGKPFDSSAEFMLPSGAAYAPDAAWVSNGKLARLSKDQRRKFLALVPEFVVEVMSPSDWLPKARARAQQWLDEGVELVWLIHGDKRTAYIYRRGQEPEVRSGIRELAGDGPVKGFVLKLGAIWLGL